MKKTSMVAVLALGAGLLAGCQTAKQVSPAPGAGHAKAVHGEALADGISADAALARLKAGNERFRGEHLKHPDQGLVRVHELEAGQHPYAIIVSCSDSRVPPEIVFDEGLGDLFVVREAGHVADAATLGSVEYAVEHLHAHLVVVLGHEHCGAVAAASEVITKNAKSSTSWTPSGRPSSGPSPAEVTCWPGQCGPTWTWLPRPCAAPTRSCSTIWPKVP
jgi:carbonic anhydrase